MVAADIAQKESERFAEALTKEVSLAGVGRHEWARLWDAARAYSILFCIPDMKRKAVAFG